MPEASIISMLIDAGQNQPADTGACYRSHRSAPNFTMNDNAYVCGSSSSIDC